MNDNEFQVLKAENLRLSDDNRLLAAIVRSQCPWIKVKVVAEAEASAIDQVRGEMADVVARLQASQGLLREAMMMIVEVRGGGALAYRIHEALGAGVEP